MIMNQQKKRKFSSTICDTSQRKKAKFDVNKTDSFQHKKKKIKKLKSSSESVVVNVNTSKQNIMKSEPNFEKQTGKKNTDYKTKKRQWQSVKDKRTRNKKKYSHLETNQSSTSPVCEKDIQFSQNVTSIDKTIAKLPQDSSEYSSNWKNLMQVLHIPPTKKKKKIKNGVNDSSPSPKKEGETKAPEIWFDDVDDVLLDKQPVSTLDQPDKLVKLESFTGLTKDVSMDCEMVGVGWDGRDNQLARVSIVNHYGNCVCDKFVKPKENVVDYRTHVSGIRPEDLEDGEDFEVVQKEVSEILNDRLLIGHAIHNDLKVLYISHPKMMIRDTSTYKPFRQLFNGRNPSLKKLTAKVLGVTVQEGEHNSIQDAQAAMRLYTMNKKNWEKDMKNKHKRIKKGTKKKKKK